MKVYPAQTITGAVLAALTAGTALAEEPTLEWLAKPQSEVTFGLTGVGGGTRRFGMYNGMSDSGIYPMVSGNLNQRNDETGTWVRASGQNFGIDGGRMRLEYEKQGDWRVYMEGTRTSFVNPREIKSSIDGLGTTVNTLTGTAPREIELKLSRENGKIGVSKKFGDGFEFTTSARVERKTGRRQWGVLGASNLFNFAVEPIEFTTQEYQGAVSYTGKRFQLQAGYLGSIFTNDAEWLKTASTTENQLSLPLNNQAHQLYFNGGYSFTPTTRGTFNASLGRTIQNENFFTRPTFAGNNRSDLGGKVDNTLLGLGLSSRPMKDLSTRIKLRYENRDDKTDLAQYVPASTSRTGYNLPFSRQTGTGDVEADYLLPMDFKLTGGFGYERYSRSTPQRRQTAWRVDTEELTGRLTLRRPLLDTLSGSIGYVFSDRTGSSYLPDNTDLVNPILWADRTRNKGRATLDWAPSDDLSFQLIGEAALDRYSGRALGPRDGAYYFAALDANYRLSEDWDLTGWVSFNLTAIEQHTRTSSGARWEADLAHVGKAIGTTLNGKLSEHIKVNIDLQHSDDKSSHGIFALAGSTGIPASLPDIVYRQSMAMLTGDYAIQQNYGVKLRYGVAQLQARDWTWRNFTYADGTTVNIPKRELIQFVGVSFYYNW